MYSTKTSWFIFGCALALALFASLYNGCAKADTYLILGAGYSRAVVDDHQAVPAWQQDLYPHHEDLRSQFWTIGLGHDFNNWLSGEMRYYDAGTIYSQSQWGLYDDGARIPNGPCSGHGSVHTTGGVVGLVGRYRYQYWSAGIEAGANIWRAPYTEHIECGSHQFDYGPVKASGVSPMMGILLEYRHFGIRYERLESVPRDGFTKGQDVVMGTWRIGL